MNFLYSLNYWISSYSLVNQFLISSEIINWNSFKGSKSEKPERVYETQDIISDYTI